MIRSILHYIDASDGNMEEGSLRVDLNISVKKKGETTLRPKIEVKNMNSFSNIEAAFDAEVRRQIALYEADPAAVLPPATHRWDPETGTTKVMRVKEGTEDYRYFPEPDLPPLLLSEEYIETIRKELPELPLERKRRYLADLGLSQDVTAVLINDKKLSDYFEKGLSSCPDTKSLANWIVVEFAARFKDTGYTLDRSEISPENVAKLVNFINDHTITGKIAKQVADEMMASPGKDCAEIISENPDFRPLRDEKEIEQLVDRVLRENPESVADYQNGRFKAFAFLVGAVMKLSRGKASPALVNEILKKKL